MGQRKFPLGLWVGYSEYKGFFRDELDILCVLYPHFTEKVMFNCFERL